MLEVDVIGDAAAAEVALDPLRRRILAALAEPGSASSLAARLELPRQKVNYHLRILERHGLVEEVEQRRRGNFTERILQARSASFVISPDAMGRMQPDPGSAPDRLSARWLLALASRLVRDVGVLLTGARRAGRPVATFAMDGHIRFASAADRAAFAEELSEVVADLVARHHTAARPDTVGTGKLHRLVIALHPAVPASADPHPDHARPDDPRPVHAHPDDPRPDDSRPGAS
ncbi:MAG: ArsR/SmtB family transcription factor [Dietzia sp.]